MDLRYFIRRRSIVGGGGILIHGFESYLVIFRGVGLEMPLIPRGDFGYYFALCDSNDSVSYVVF